MRQGYGETFKAAHLLQPRGVIAHGTYICAGLRAADIIREAPPGIRPCEGQARAVATPIGACDEAQEGPNRRQLLQMARAKASAKAVFASMLLLEEQHKSSAQSKHRGSCHLPVEGLWPADPCRRAEPMALGSCRVQSRSHVAKPAAAAAAAAAAAPAGHSNRPIVQS